MFVPPDHHQLPGFLHQAVSELLPDHRQLLTARYPDHRRTEGHPDRHLAVIEFPDRHLAVFEFPDRHLAVFESPDHHLAVFESPDRHLAAFESPDQSQVGSDHYRVIVPDQVGCTGLVHLKINSHHIIEHKHCSHNTHTTHTSPQIETTARQLWVICSSQARVL